MWVDPKKLRQAEKEWAAMPQSERDKMTKALDQMYDDLEKEGFKIKHVGRR